MPNNRPLADNRLNGYLRTLNRKPMMKEDYFQFIGKVFERGHAVASGRVVNTKRPSQEERTIEAHRIRARAGGRSQRRWTHMVLTSLWGVPS